MEIIEIIKRGIELLKPGYKNDILLNFGFVKNAGEKIIPINKYARDVKQKKEIIMKKDKSYYYKVYCKTGSLLGYMVKGIVAKNENEVKQKIKKQYGYKVMKIETISIENFLLLKTNWTNRVKIKKLK